MVFFISGYIWGTKRATGDPLQCTGVKTARVSRNFQIFKMMNFCCFFLDFGLYLGKEKSFWRSAGNETTGI